MAWKAHILTPERCKPRQSLVIRCQRDSRGVAATVYLTTRHTTHYIEPMSEELDKSFTQELQRLGKRVDELVVICNQLKEENRSLKERQDSLIADRATLLQKNEQVRARVEAMIGRLKAMESGT